MSWTPTAISNQALDAVGCKETLGDLEEGSRSAQICLRWYDQCLQQLLRSAHWNFARKQVPLVLLADATGTTPNISTTVVQPWIYEYMFPQDCMKGRFVPATPFIPPGSVPANNITTPGSSQPQTGGTLGLIPPLLRLVPARWLETNDVNFPADTSQPGWWEQPNISPAGRRVICTNQPCASFVYTQYMPYPNMWDARFREAMVHYLASEIVLALNAAGLLGTPVPQAISLKKEQYQFASLKVREARVTDGNEGVFSTDHCPDWMSIRGGYGGSWGGGGLGSGYPGVWGGGYFYAGWDTSWFGNTGAF